MNINDIIKELEGTSFTRISSITLSSKLPQNHLDVYMQVNQDTDVFRLKCYVYDLRSRRHLCTSTKDVPIVDLGSPSFPVPVVFYDVLENALSTAADVRKSPEDENMVDMVLANYRVGYCSADAIYDSFPKSFPSRARVKQILQILQERGKIPVSTT